MGERCKMNEEWVNISEEFSPKHAKNREKQGQDPAAVNITINYPMAYENAIQKLKLEKKVSSRSQAIRLAIGEFLKKEEKFFKRLKK